MTLNSDFKGGVCSTMDEVLYLNKLNHKNFTYRVLPEYLYWFNNVIYFRKNSPFIKAFDEKISLFKSAGLIEFWVSKYLDVAYLNFKETSKAPRKFNIEQLEGGLRLWIYGCLISSLVFIFEYMYSNCLKFSRIIKHT